MYGNKIRFFIHDISKDKLNKKYDYILFIETLEHIEKPKEAIEKYLEYCNKRILVTVPYKELGWKEHVYYFDENSFNDIKEFKEFHIFNKPKASTRIILYIFDKKS